MAAVSVFGMAAAGSHSTPTATARRPPATATAAPATTPPPTPPARATPTVQSTPTARSTPHRWPSRPGPYDPTKPIDLGGVEGVTPEQQAAPRTSSSITLIELPQFADPAVAEAAGCHSIGDGGTGHEHLINGDLIDDGRILDPDYPESLVYDTSGGGTPAGVGHVHDPRGTSLDDVPELGGPLTQWHVHDDLCFSPGENPRVAGITTVGGTCRAPLQKFDPTPMIHVWIEPHVCGPFAALEGVGRRPGEAGRGAPLQPRARGRVSRRARRGRRGRRGRR